MTNLVARVRDEGKGDVGQVLGEALGGGRGPPGSRRGPRHHTVGGPLLGGHLACCLSPGGIKEGRGDLSSMAIFRV